jgi:hypothetical protein
MEGGIAWFRGARGEKVTMQTIADDRLLSDLLAAGMPPGRPPEEGGDETPPEPDEEESEPDGG